VDVAFSNYQFLHSSFHQSCQENHVSRDCRNSYYSPLFAVSFFSYTNKFTPLKAQPKEVERVVLQLLKPPGLQYIREMSKILDQDPDYLQFHSASVTIRVREILSKNNQRIAEPAVTEINVPRIVREAVVRLRSVEK